MARRRHLAHAGALQPQRGQAAGGPPAASGYAASGEFVAPGCCTAVAPPKATATELARWARVFRALGDPTRVGILALLAAQRKPLCVCDIVAQFPLEQPTISHHLKVLRQAGLVSGERRGLWVYYRLSEAGLMEAWRAIGRLIP